MPQGFWALREGAPERAPCTLCGAPESCFFCAQLCNFQPCSPCKVKQKVWDHSIKHMVRRELCKGTKLFPATVVTEAST